MFSSNTSQVSQDADYIEDVFSTWLYTGNGSTQTITNGIDLAGEGGLVWIKGRAFAYDHKLTDTVRGVTKAIISNSSDAQTTDINGLTSFVSNGFSLGLDPTYNTDLDTYVSWTFREQPKFFDVVAYTGDGTTNRLISHNLQSTPGMLLVKRTDLNTNWAVWHRRSGGVGAHGSFNTTLGMSAILSTVSGVPDEYVAGANNSAQFLATAGMNTNGATYVAYLFAHNAGGFGLTGADNVITCGAYTGTGTTPGPEVTLGYEPQFLMIRNYNSGGNWNMFDSMRGLPASGSSARYLQGNTANAEASATWVSLTATGFKIDSTSAEVNTATYPYLYVAIRRGPMKVPTTGTSVFAPRALTNSTGTKNTTGFPVDLQLARLRTELNDTVAVDRLRGVSTTTTGGERVLLTNETNAEISGTTTTRAWNNTGFQTASGYNGYSAIYWNFRRAPGFFDEVCYTGTGANTTVTHNLAAVPELMLVKQRSGTTNWIVYSKSLAITQVLILNLSTGYVTAADAWNSTSPTASVFTVGTAGAVNLSGGTFVAYLFASCPGVSKVGSYTGTGTTLQIDCGFAAGSRFVLIKRTDAGPTGDWYVWDSARGIVAGNDPYLLLNNVAAEVTSTDYVDTYSAGFEISSTAPAAINDVGGSYIFLAIA